MSANDLHLVVQGPPASGKTKMLGLIDRMLKLHGYVVAEVGEHALKITPPVPAKESEMVVTMQAALNQYRQIGEVTNEMQLRMAKAIKNATEEK